MWQLLLSPLYLHPESPTKFWEVDYWSYHLVSFKAQLHICKHWHVSKTCRHPKHIPNTWLWHVGLVPFRIISIKIAKKRTLCHLTWSYASFADGLVDWEYYDIGAWTINFLVMLSKMQIQPQFAEGFGCRLNLQEKCKLRLENLMHQQEQRWWGKWKLELG